MTNDLAALLDVAATNAGAIGAATTAAAASMRTTARVLPRTTLRLGFSVP